MIPAYCIVWSEKHFFSIQLLACIRCSTAVIFLAEQSPPKLCRCPSPALVCFPLFFRRNCSRTEKCAFEGSTVSIVAEEGCVCRDANVLEIFYFAYVLCCDHESASAFPPPLPPGQISLTNNYRHPRHDHHPFMQSLAAPCVGTLSSQFMYRTVSN